MFCCCFTTVDLIAIEMVFFLICINLGITVPSRYIYRHFVKSPSDTKDSVDMLLHAPMSSTEQEQFVKKYRRKQRSKKKTRPVGSGGVCLLPTGGVVRADVFGGCTTANMKQKILAIVMRGQ